MISWLDLEQNNDREIFRRIWMNSLHRRPHDHPDYLELIRPENYHSAIVVYRQAESATIYYPFHWTRIGSHQAFANQSEDMFHMVSPYGYGGPIYEGNAENKDECTSAFNSLLAKELEDRKIISEFIREDIFGERMVTRTQGNRFQQQMNVVVRLQRSDDEIWRKYKAKVRKNVNRARSSRLRVEFDPTGRCVDGFLSIYEDTMRRKNAARAFFINKEKFINMNQGMMNDNALLYAHVYKENRIVSTELILLSRDTMYSFLGGTLVDAFEMRPNDFLKHQLILWGREHGYQWFVMGGGVTPNDGIFQFKEAFDPGSIWPFYTACYIHNRDKYDLLIRCRHDYEKRQGNNWSPRNDFFPAFFS